MAGNVLLDVVCGLVFLRFVLGDAGKATAAEPHPLQLE